ncbi:5-(carboxyamino)imidazole ribonucleotide synthase [Thiohalophilus sp.]|uniref:5-(carboxyamino)imidazole ribonucleotide synthase n=1 Tax=Thiohalophilus sp. TaxID=3028392 RepID=UPI002ACE2C96|nr:5-(carboxyamino)imidazole ribonucleotide synthase [Thiohalophilus sp.]MDZ7661908.1 5-(carboxyamino)imidazole ribonucleotide synthase [Thiohalophilus sp.]MDZ7803775.1 5-(carboxyamino)imidazole ribonucleotide synthase [Thiohalophilus sp.]
MLLPGATLGMLGGGQLGRMFTIAARNMGYEVVVLDPDPDSPAGMLASDHVCADYLDTTALQYLSETCDAITTEFENVPAESLEYLAEHCDVRPGARAVTLTQDRISEKTFLHDNGFATAPFAVIREPADLDAAARAVPTPAILKIARFGYDGKGQYPVASGEELADAWQELGNNPCVLEQRVDLDLEISVVVARGIDGETRCYPVAENVHRHGILDVSLVPARIDTDLEQQVLQAATAIAGTLDYVGVLAVEFFVSHGELLVNEIAPRPHNSGHYTLDATLTSQFEQQVRAVCGLPLGDPRLLSPVVMINLLGDLWQGQTPPDWRPLFARANAKLHLYGKREARVGRKMGHYNVLAPTLDEALQTAQAIQQQLARAEVTRDE